MRIAFYADLACPFCCLGHHRLTRAVAVAGAEPEVVHRPFQLQPDAPATPVPLRQAMESRYGADRYAAMAADLMALSRDDGIDFRLDRAQLVNTLQAHRALLAAGRRHGGATQSRLKTELFRAYFTDGLDTGDPVVLAELGERAGVDGAQLRHDLGQAEDLPALHHDLAAARSVTRVVPTLVTDTGRRLVGDRPAAEYLSLIEEQRESVTSALVD